MTRHDVREYLPDLYGFFAECTDEHPFWQAVTTVHLKDVKRGRTLLPLLDRFCSSLSAIDGNHIVAERLHNAQTHEELMTFLTQLYVAYLYREHGPRFIHGDHGYHIEVEIADQLLALGVVSFHDFRAPTIQFADEISDTTEYLEHLKLHAQQFAQHPTARHHVLADVTDHSQLHREVELSREVQKQQKEMTKHFPHLSGIILVDPTPGREQAKFIPFHEGNSDLEQLLHKVN